MSKSSRFEFTLDEDINKRKQAVFVLTVDKT